MMGIDEALYPMIFKRKSFHLFYHTGAEKITLKDMEEIYRVYENSASLYPDIKTAIRIVPAEKIASKRGQEYCILFYSKKKSGYLQNIGYIGQQLDLYLVSQNIGTLWFGMGKPDEPLCNGLEFVIMMAIAKIDDEKRFCKDMFKSKRKPKEELWTGEDIPGVADIVRFAPSACNSQPWFVEHCSHSLQVYRYKKPGKRGIIPAAKVSFYNQIDIGIFLCFLELCLTHNGIDFDRKCFLDAGTDKEKTLVASYSLRQSALCLPKQQS